MELDHRIQRLSAQVRYRRELIGLEMSERALRTSVLRGDQIRIVRGAYVAKEVWHARSPEEQLVMRAVAKSRGRRGPPLVFSHVTAAALWGLPVYGNRLGPLDVTREPGSPARRSPELYRRLHELAECEVVHVGGLRFTTLERTVMDLAMSCAGEVAIGCADAAVRHALRARDSRYENAQHWRAEMGELISRNRRRHGSRRARAIVDEADPRADSVLESVSRLHLRRLGVPLDIQVPVHGFTGQSYWVDFEFLEEGALGEVDGTIKYSDPQAGDGRAPVHRLIQEKEREDEIRGTTGKRIIRWGSRHLTDQYTLGRRLLAFGIRVPAMQ